jgi:phosphoribosylamine--glycine ligase
MKVLIIGSGGREDAIAWKLNGESSISDIFVSPGNAGMTRLEKVSCFETESMSDLVNRSLQLGVDLCICGPEAPLTSGISKLFEDQGILFFGPSAQGAQLEGSKIFSKEFMARNSIPTAKFNIAKSYNEAIDLLDKWDMTKGIVIKADGLAGGKGVVVTYSAEEARETVFDFMQNPEVSIHSEQLLLEEVLPGEEVSCFALCSHENFFFLGSACDHKRVGDGDTGPNTGGMGCFRDRQWPDQALQEKVKERVLKSTLAAMVREGTPFVGFLFMGLMVDDQGEPWVIEYNVRMGDPETQTLLPLLKGDFGSALMTMLNAKGEGLTSESINLSLADQDSVHVVLTSGGYPSIGKHSMSLGHEIVINDTEDNEGEVFFAGVKRSGETLVNSGGRVLGVTCTGGSLEECRKNTYNIVEKIKLEDSHYRKDIAAKKRGGSP